MSLDFTWSAPLVGTPQKRPVLQTPLFSEVIQPDLRVSVTFPNHWEPLEHEANQINRITIPEVQFIKFLLIYWSNPTIRHTLVFTAGSHETCLDLLGYGEPHSNPQCQQRSWYKNLFIFFSCYSPFFTQANRAVSPECSQSSGQTISMSETAGDSYACNDGRVNVENPHRFTFQGLYCHT